MLVSNVLYYDQLLGPSVYDHFHIFDSFDILINRIDFRLTCFFVSFGNKNIFENSTDNITRLTLDSPIVSVFNSEPRFSFLLIDP